MSENRLKRMIIVGAGGLGQEALAQLLGDYALGTEWLVAGFLDERGPERSRCEPDFPWLGAPCDYTPGPLDIFTAAVGDPRSRERQAEALKARGAPFVSIRTRCTLGRGCRFGASFFSFDVSCGVHSVIGDGCYLDQGAVIGHDTTVGDYAHIGTRAVIAGNSRIGRGATIHSGALIARNVTIGEYAVVAMGAVVFGNVPPGVTVMGNPARRFDAGTRESAPRDADSDANA